MIKKYSNKTTGFERLLEAAGNIDEHTKNTQSEVIDDLNDLKIEISEKIKPSSGIKNHILVDILSSCSALIDYTLDKLEDMQLEEYEIEEVNQTVIDIENIIDLVDSVHSSGKAVNKMSDFEEAIEDMNQEQQASYFNYKDTFSGSGEFAMPGINPIQDEDEDEDEEIDIAGKLLKYEITIDELEEYYGLSIKEVKELLAKGVTFDQIMAVAIRTRSEINSEEMLKDPSLLSAEVERLQRNLPAEASIILDLVKLANALDQKGLHKDADIIDNFLNKKLGK